MDLHIKSKFPRLNTYYGVLAGLARQKTRELRMRKRERVLVGQGNAWRGMWPELGAAYHSVKLGAIIYSAEYWPHQPPDHPARHARVAPRRRRIWSRISSVP